MVYLCSFATLCDAAEQSYLARGGGVLLELAASPALFTRLRAKRLRYPPASQRCEL